MTHRLPPVVPAAEERALAVAAECDPRTLRRALHGMPVMPLTLGRIRLALRRAGRADLLPVDGQAFDRRPLAPIVSLVARRDLERGE